MKRTLTIILAITLLSLASCKEEGYGRGAWHKSFISSYIAPEQIIIEEQQKPGVHLDIHINGNRIYPEQETAYYIIATKNHDTSFNQIWAGPPIICYTQDIQKMSILSIDEFDNEKAAGSDISEYVTVTFSTVSEFIKNNYKTPSQPDYSREENDMDFEHPQYGKIAHKYWMHELNAINTHLCNDTFRLKFHKHPIKNGNFRFKLIIEFSDCTLEQQLTYEF